MKKLIILLLAFLNAIHLHADEGIRFRQGSWNEVLALAKKENKLVFIDVYTTWCGPCKKMDKEVFPRKEVGDLFNASFINYKIDAEKGEGVGVASQFGVRSYPTYLFVNGDGQLVYRTGSYLPSGSFLQEAAIALKEKDDPKPLAAWEAEYANGKKDKAFLLGYMKKRALLKLPSAEIVEQAFSLLTSDDLQNKEVVSSLFFYDARNEYLPGGKAFSFVVNHYKTLDSMKLVRAPLAIMETGITNYFRKKIIENKDKKMLPVMINAYRTLLQAGKAPPLDIALIEKELPVKFYSGTGDTTKLLPAVKDYVQNGIFRLDIAGKQKEDAEGYAKFIEPFHSGKADSTSDEKFAVNNRIMKTRRTAPIALKLRDAAEAVYHASTNKMMLAEATAWSKQAADWFPHFSTGAVYAGLLLKTGKKPEALAVMQAACNDPILKDHPEVHKILKDAFQNMQQGIAPIKLWKQ